MTDLQIFKDKEKNKDIIVLGAGASLKDLSEKDVKGKVIIAVNGSIMRFEKVDYFFTCDPGVFAHEYSKEIFKRAKRVILANPFLEPMENVKKRVFCVNRKYGMKTRSGGNSINEYDLMRKEDSKLIVGTDSVQTACHFAYVMSDKPIELKGVDLKFIDGKKHYHDNAYIKGKEREIPICLKIVHPTTERDNSLQVSYNAWAKLNQLNKHVNIINRPNNV